jgi:hypothetical protein
LSHLGGEIEDPVHLSAKFGQVPTLDDLVDAAAPAGRALLQGQVPQEARGARPLVQGRGLF